ncbi:hypothetical protein BPAE_0344g00100 [Botrytis paeoniae]|uniref:Uncharacterized protein n=1 Tax=Botrytis paeoniae TaxID=278948 RepID=A0A4Z1F3U6_9HELO|nr:hypothetical protein BPAE_0344g00100 [Botrytis paeoniae]
MVKTDGSADIDEEETAWKIVLVPIIRSPPYHAESFRKELRNKCKIEHARWSREFDSDTAKRASDTMECLTDLWTFGDYVQITGLQVSPLMLWNILWTCCINWLHELTALVYQLINDDSKLRRWPVSSLVAAVDREMDYLIIHQGPNQSYIDMQKHHIAYSVGGDSRVDVVTMSNRAAMMRFYVEDPVMPEPIVEDG